MVEYLKPLQQLKPRTVGEKVLVIGGSVDIALLAAVAIEFTLEKIGISNPSPNARLAFTDFMLGTHIALADGGKFAGLLIMLFFEKRNWLKGRSSTADDNSQN